jgi:hypothetical protein
MREQMLLPRRHAAGKVSCLLPHASATTSYPAASCPDSTASSTPPAARAARPLLGLRVCLRTTITSDAAKNVPRVRMQDSCWWSTQLHASSLLSRGRRRGGWHSGLGPADGLNRVNPVHSCMLPPCSGLMEGGRAVCSAPALSSRSSSLLAAESAPRDIVALQGLVLAPQGLQPRSQLKESMLGPPTTRQTAFSGTAVSPATPRQPTPLGRWQPPHDLLSPER